MAQPFFSPPCIQMHFMIAVKSWSGNEILCLLISVDSFWAQNWGQWKWKVYFYSPLYQNCKYYTYASARDCVLPNNGKEETQL